MSRPNAKVTIEVTEKELAFITRVTGFPNYRFLQLQDKLSAAGKAMRLAKREVNREAKAARNERRAG